MKVARSWFSVDGCSLIVAVVRGCLHSCECWFLLDVVVCSVKSVVIWCRTSVSVVQGRSGGVQDPTSHRQHPGKEPAHQTSARQPASFSATQGDVSMRRTDV